MNALFSKGSSRILPMLLGGSLFKKGSPSGGLANTLFRKAGDVIGRGKASLAPIAYLLDAPLIKRAADRLDAPLIKRAADRLGINLDKVNKRIDQVGNTLEKAKSARDMVNKYA